MENPLDAWERAWKLFQSARSFEEVNLASIMMCALLARIGFVARKNGEQPDSLVVELLEILRAKMGLSLEQVHQMGEQVDMPTIYRLQRALMNRIEVRRARNIREGNREATDDE